MTETMQSLTEVLMGLAQSAMNDGKEVTDQPLFIQVSSDHTEIHIRKGDLHIMVARGADAAVYNCVQWHEYPVVNPFWSNDLKVADILSAAWEMSYDADRVMTAVTK
jgi:hypothetical protein